jgi:hypothetical protein
MKSGSGELLPTAFGAIETYLLHSALGVRNVGPIWLHRTCLWLGVVITSQVSLTLRAIRASVIADRARLGFAVLRR